MTIPKTWIYSDSLVAINAIIGNTVIPKKIINIVEDKGILLALSKEYYVHYYNRKLNRILMLWLKRPVCKTYVYYSFL